MTDRPVALVTAASRGIGAACARELARRGYRLALLARSEGLKDLARELDAVAVTGSVSEAADLERLVAAAVERFGRVDAVVNNTGHPAKGDLLALADADWEAGVDLILLSVVRMARLATPHFLRQGGGAIVNVSSLWAAEPQLDAPVSSTLRAALSAFTKLYADRYAKDRIRMNCLLAGFVTTYPVPEKFFQAIPMARVSEPEEVARVAAFLLSP
ncbi:MAG TPA: SDR family oxidoreductase, partial [Thermoanaerobaculia bacterium]|nr:SDR family oxidoreductase [Thermoanaerobaculia bacterium]